MPLLPQRMEAEVKDTFMWFDGEVLEIFGFDRQGSTRIAPRMIKGIAYANGMVTLTYIYDDFSMLTYTPDQEPALQALLNAVLAARPAPAA